MRSILRFSLFVGLLFPWVSLVYGSTWETLDSEIKQASTEKEMFDFAKFLGFVKTNALLNRSGPSELIQMSVQTNFPGARAGAFLALHERFPDRAFVLGLKLGVSPEVNLWVQTFYLIALTNPISQASFDFGVTSLMQTVGAPDDKLSMAVMTLSYEQLWNWYQTRDREGSILQSECFVLGRLCLESREHGKQLTEGMRQRLRLCRNLPGLPRATYLICMEPSDPGYKEVMIQGLRDETLRDSDLSRIVLARAGFISEQIPIERLEISEKRRLVIEKWISTGKKIRELRKENGVFFPMPLTDPPGVAEALLMNLKNAGKPDEQLKAAQELAQKLGFGSAGSPYSMEVVFFTADHELLERSRWTQETLRNVKLVAVSVDKGTNSVGGCAFSVLDPETVFILRKKARNGDLQRF